MYICMLARASWNSKIVFSIDAVKECILWLKNVERLNEIESQLCQLTYNEAQDAYIFNTILEFQLALASIQIYICLVLKRVCSQERLVSK
jgi:hypothetical protein